MTEAVDNGFGGPIWPTKVKVVAIEGSISA